MPDQQKNEPSMGNTGSESYDGLEVACPDCRTRGGSRYRSGWVDCNRCSGRGYVPTEAGERLLVFLRRQWDECPF
jgi:hypothetical protein